MTASDAGGTCDNHMKEPNNKQGGGRQQIQNSAAKYGIAAEEIRTVAMKLILLHSALTCIAQNCTSINSVVISDHKIMWKKVSTKLGLQQSHYFPKISVTFISSGNHHSSSITTYIIPTNVFH